MYPSLSNFYYLNDLIDPTDLRGSDKGSRHSYIDGYYNIEFTPKRHEPLSILEIGILNGGSLYLWSNFFTQATIYGIDVIDVDNFLLNPYRVKIYKSDAYSDEILKEFSDESLDYIIDDGPHTFESQKMCIQKWLPKLKKNGKIIIEDIQSEEFAIKLKFYALEFDDVNSSTIIDLRLNKHRYDDIILEIIKR